MAFMELYIYDKRDTYSADCDTCGATLYGHDATGTTAAEILDGTAECPHCANGHASRDSARYEGRQYAGRYSANGYLDCTDWHFSPNKRALARDLRDLYGAEDA